MPTPTTPPEIRFWRHVKKTKTCWLWTGSTNQNRQGRFFVSHSEIVTAYRFSWVLHNGPIPAGLCVLHTCDDGLCVRPQHLFLGTQLDNMRDKRRKGRGNHDRGETCHNAKLSDTQVEEIRTLWREQRHTQTQIAERFGVGQPHISRLVLKRRRRTGSTVPRFYVAVGKKGTFTKTLKKTKEEVITEVKNKVLAEPSTIKIKQALANYPDTTWVFATFNIKFTLDNVLQLLRDYRKIDAEEIQEVKVSEGSRVTFHKITPKKIAK